MKKQGREAEPPSPKVALSPVPVRRPPAASVSRTPRATGAATVAAAPSRGFKAGRRVVTTAAATGRRSGWDMPGQGKVSEIKAKLQSYQSRDRTAQEETRELRGPHRGLRPAEGGADGQGAGAGGVGAPRLAEALRQGGDDALRQPGAGAAGREDEAAPAGVQPAAGRQVVLML
ncbi:unnamed protein product [Arctogadus glacialis]